MKICAACHQDLPKESYSKKQWKLDKYHRRCKVCTANNREVQQTPKQKLVTLLDSICLDDNIDTKRISDKELFKQPPQKEDCPICFLRLPCLCSGSKYMSCCGKIVCSGCIHAPVYDNQGNEVDYDKCPFCRTPFHYSEEELIEREMKRAEAGDAHAMYNLGYNYGEGLNGYPQDNIKALKLFHRAGEMGYNDAYLNIGSVYEFGEGVVRDLKKAKYYYEIGAIGGDASARHNLGCFELEAGNYDRALKHYMIAVVGGWSESLKMMKVMYSKGDATREEYTKALQSYQVYLDEIKSKQRDEAAAYDIDDYRNY